MPCLSIQHGNNLFSHLILLTHLLARLMNWLGSLMRQLDLQMQHVAIRIMIIADGISIMYLQTMACAYQIIYAAYCAMTVDD